MSNPIIAMINSIAEDLMSLEKMLDNGFGDKAFRMKINAIGGKGKRLKALIESVGGGVSSRPLVKQKASPRREDDADDVDEFFTDNEEVVR